MSIIVEGLKTHAIPKETFSTGNQVLNVPHTAHIPSSYPQAAPSFSRHASTSQKYGFVFLWAKHTMEKSPHLKRKCSSFLSPAPETSEPHFPGYSDHELTVPWTGNRRSCLSCYGNKLSDSRWILIIKLPVQGNWHL